MTTDQALQLARQHHTAGRLAEAERIYRQILAQHPTRADALCLLGSLAMQVGRHDAAVELIRRAIAAHPGDPVYHNSLAMALGTMGKLDEAIVACRAAIALKSDYIDPYNNLAVALMMQERLDEAIVVYRQALQIKPDAPEVLCNLGVALMKSDKCDEAVVAFNQSIQFRPEYPSAHYNLGQVFQGQGKTEDAIAAYGEALRLKPDFAEARTNLGQSLEEAGQFDQAMACYDEALRLRPDSADAHLNRGLLLMLRGDLERGWPDYEWRARAREFGWLARNFIQPRWNGEVLTGRTILLHAEQGFGDTLQFIRYAPQVAARGGRVIFECPPELSRLLHSMADQLAITEQVIAGQPPPAFDLHCPLLSLPLILGTRMETIPAAVPYIKADPALALAWRKRMSPSGASLNVALAWSGNPKQKVNPIRSLSLAQLAPLARVPGIRFHSVQKGPAAAQAAQPPAAMELIDLSDDLNDFADTAALLANVDLVITTCTAVAHLAGAMGKRVWVMLAFKADWRWFLHRDDSPWYPTMRLFRQSSRGDWNSVIAGVGAELQRLACPGNDDVR
jgi:tetratricopeptide (TPR) repeat protein